jgi:hypothetical protein
MLFKDLLSIMHLPFCYLTGKNLNRSCMIFEDLLHFFNDPILVVASISTTSQVLAQRPRSQILSNSPIILPVDVLHCDMMAQS